MQSAVRVRWAACALALLLPLLVSSVPRRQHLVRCSEPQPRAVPAGSLVEASPTEELLPPYAVLHRCDDSAGLCLAPLSCVATGLEEVQLVFHVTDVLEPASSEERYRVVVARNHTSCGCRAPDR